MRGHRPMHEYRRPRQGRQQGFPCEVDCATGVSRACRTAGAARIFQFAQAFARDHHDIPASQGFLVMAERFADQAFEAIALDGELDVLLADHQAQAG